MSIDYTNFNSQSMSGYSSVDDDLDAIDFLKDSSNFRPFNKGLKEIIIKKGFKGNPDDNSATSRYLISRLGEINSDINKETVYSWFSGKHRPKIEAGSRKRIYEICFALNLSFEETVWFFHHVYFDRCFNCHNIEEAVYYYSFLNGVTYQEATSIIDTINNAPYQEETVADKTINNYTQFIQERISGFKSVDELQEFLIDNKANFNSWNGSAITVIKKLLLEITGGESSKAVVDTLKRNLKNKLNSNKELKRLDEINISEENFDKCGLLIKEILLDAKTATVSASEYVLEAISGRNVSKNSFVLDCLLSTVTGIPKNADIPYVVKNNFPSKKILSDVLDESKVTISKSYDSIRKTIVLFDFYVFWVRVKLGLTDISEYTTKDLFEIYKDEADTRLYECGYEPLYAGNPYDWIFLCSARNEDPLTFFRFCISGLISDEW